MPIKPNPAMQGLEDTWGSNSREVQGQYGQSLSNTNPMWARWFDQVHQAAPNAHLALSKGQTGFQPEGDLANDPSWWLKGLQNGPYAPTAASLPAHIRGLLKLPNPGVTDGPYKG